jgi:anthranilate synthase component 1
VLLALVPAVSVAGPAGVRPTLDEFRALAATHTVVPVWRDVLADLETPVSAFHKLVGERDGFLLESVEHGERWGRFSFLGLDPALVMVVNGRRVTWHGTPPPGVPSDAGALAALEALLAHHRSPRIEELPPFHGGIVGYLGYDVVREVERLPDVPHDDAGLPDAVMALTRAVAAFDHLRQRVSLIANVFLGEEATPDEVDAAYHDAAVRLAVLEADLGRPLAYASSPPPVAPDDGAELGVVGSSFSSERYRDAVDVAKEHILAGDIFQVVLSQRFDVGPVDDAFAVYRALRQLNPSPYMYFVRGAGVTLVGSSPEPMVQLLDGRVVSRPIAGTRRRGRTAADEARMAAELIEDPKERAEHVMLVDLARNDVGRVARFGTEQVDELMTLERYSHVMHITSQVSAELADGRSPVDVLRATFPAGTVSGAPKVRAMEIIDALEPTKRGPYAGVVGYLDFSGNLDTAIAIRTLVVHDGGASVQAGAGIVADSDAALEDLECHNKARALLGAVVAARTLARLAPPGPSEATS